MSSPWHVGMLCAFDLETTGTDVETARIVTACVSIVDGSGLTEPSSRNWLVNPGIEIPEEATKVHGITTEQAFELGRHPYEAVREIAVMLGGPAAGIVLVPIVAFNASYDLTVLDRETRRHGLSPFGPDLDDAKAVVVDPFVLDKALDPYRRGSRKLGDVAAHYGVKAEGAHTADGDAIAAARVAWKIAVLYPHIARMTLTELHAFQVTERRRQAASFRDYLRRRGKAAEAAAVDGEWPWRPVAAEAAA